MKRVGLVLGLLLAAVVWFWPLPSLTPDAHRLAAVVTLVIIWWIAEPLPLWVTGLLGIGLTLVFRIAHPPQIFSAFTDSIVFLFIGTFLMAKAMQVHDVDRRLAYALLANPWVGSSTARTVFAVGLAAWLSAMWMSITACVAMIFPLVRAIAKATHEAQHGSESPAKSTRYETALMLALVYAASAGAMSTPVGTPPNLIGLGFIKRELGVQVPFLTWMIFAMPLAALLWLTRYFLVMWLFPPEAKSVPGLDRKMREEYVALGPWTPGQRNSLVALGVAIVLWVTPGISARLSPGAAALIAAGLLFILPGERFKRRVLTIKEAVKIDWGTILLFGSGIALGGLMFDTGLAPALGQQMMGSAAGGHPGLFIAAAIVVTGIMSEVASNTASANMMIPVMIGLVPGGGSQAFAVAMAATLAASLGFLLPVSSPSNAIIYASGSITSRDFVRAGIWVDLVSGVLIWLFCVYVLPIVF